MPQVGGSITKGSLVLCGSGVDLSPIVGYTDGSGSLHSITPVYLYAGGGTHGSCTTQDHINQLVNDGSGYTINAYSNGTTNTVVTAGGTVISFGSSTTITDPNGNVISASSGSPTVVTDTLGVPELSISLGSSPTLCGSTGVGATFTYPTSTGTAVVTVNCTEYSVQTDFGVKGVHEYGPANSYFPSSIDLPDGSSYAFTYESQVAGTVTGRIASVTYPSGEVVSYTYTGSGPGILLRTAANDTVYKYSTNSPSDGTNTLVSDYSTSSGHANNTSLYTFIPSPIYGTLHLVQTQEYQGAATGTPLRTTLYCYNGNLTNCTSTGIDMPVTQVDKFITLGGMSTSSRTSTTIDSYGNATMVALYDFGASTPTRKTVQGPYGYTWNGSTTSPTCTTLIGSSVNNKPCQVQLESGAGGQLRNTYFQYGTITNPGSLLSKAVLTGGSSYLITSATYNSNGTVATSTDANHNVTTLTYETCNTVSNALLTKVVPPISTLDTQYSWDTGCNGAKMMSASDPNGFSVGTTYNDPFWRPTSSTDQLLNTMTLSYYPTVPLNTSEAQMTFGSSDLDNFNTADPLGRPLYTQQIETSGGSWDTTQRGYSWNSTGQVATTTMPCAATKGSGCPNGVGITTVTHDALGRSLVTMDGGNGTVTNTYTGSSSGCGSSLLGCVDILTIVGPAPAGEVVKRVQKEYNGLGQLMSACQLSSATGTTSCGQANGGTGYLTTYSYNADGTLSSVVRGSQTHSFTYDALGRTLTAAYPESGTKYFYYDSAPSTPGVACSATALPTATGLNVSPLGNLVKTYDANGTTTCFSYDKMNRNTGIAYAGTNWDGENKYFTYDSATVNGVVMTNALGRVAEAYTAPTAAGNKATDEGFSYTARGEISDVYQSTPNSSGYYHTNATYFANHALETLTGVPGASGSPWTYSLDGKGRPYSAIQGSSTNMVSSTSYDAADEPCTVTLGAGDTDSYLYDNLTSCSASVLLTTGRMTSYAFSVGATPKTFTGTPTWNMNGTLRGLTTVDGINSGSETETCTYGTPSSPGYDEFGRLLQVNCVNASSTNIWNQTFAYDIYNNVTKSVPSGGAGSTWAPGYNPANNHYTLTGTSYDSNGNLLTDTFHTYTWNQDNHPKAMTDVGITMAYDASGRMVEKATGSSYQQTLISPVGPVALMAAQNLVQFRMPLPGGDTAVTGIYFFHRDYLGTVPLVSSRGGRASIAARLFAPYGESYNNAGVAGDLNFTGDYQDLVAGTYDTPNRELNPTQGRWISPDPANSSWNAYQYSTNPLAESDPNGADIADGYGEGTASIGAEQLDDPSTDYGAIFGSINTTQFNGQSVAASLASPPNLIQQIMNAINGVVVAAFQPELQTMDWGLANWSLFQQFGTANTTVKVGMFNNTPLNPFDHIAIGVGDSPLMGLNPASDAVFLAVWAMNAIDGCGTVVCNPSAATVVPGAILPENPNQPAENSITFTITAEQGIFIQTAIGLSEANPPNYSLQGPLPACDCGSWAQQMLGFGGIDPGPPSWRPSVVMQQLWNNMYQQEGIENPNQ
jgi:RHS repeat-associated protein